MDIRNIGDKVWVASRKSTQESIECPECFGKKYLTVILGDDSKVTIDCAGCSVGYDPSKGYILYHKLVHDVFFVAIVRVEITPGRVKYYFDDYIAGDDIVFDTKEEARVKAKLLAEEWNKAELEKVHRKEKNNRTWSWHVHYYRKKIRDAEKDIECSQRTLNAAEEHAKGEKQ